MFGRVGPALVRVSAAVVLLPALFGGSGAAQKADFAGRSIRLIHTGSEAGSYAVYTRILAEHLGKHLPGSPRVLAEFMPGAGGLAALNYLYNAAPKDGSALGMPLPSVSIAHLLFPQSAKFDPTRFTWIGNITQMQTAIGVWHTSPIKSLDDVKTTETIVGSSGRGSELSLTPQLLNAVLGTKFKIVAGYKGVGQINVAMESGEVHGRSGGLTSWHPMKPDWFKPPQKVRFIVQLGMTKHPDLPDVPLVTEFARNDEERRVLDLMSRSTTLTRAVMGPPALPAPARDALRAGFDATLKDAAFLADMKKHKMDMIGPMNWQEIETFMAEIAATPPSVIRRFQAALGVK